MRWRIKSLLDVGCGHNEFVASVREARPEIRAVGTDFACASADVRADATKLPFADKTFDALTAFDMLEHLLPDQVELVLQGFARISKAFVFSISHVPSVNKWQGEGLHPTVQPEDWWLAQIERAGGIDIHKEGKYIVGRWNGSEDVTVSDDPMLPTATCILVGNGPSVLKARKGFAIDSFDEVVRFNRFKTDGFEEHTGHRTTLWATFGRGEQPQDATIPSKVILAHENATPVGTPTHVWHIPHHYYTGYRDAVRARSKRADAEKEKLIASTGLVVAMWLLDRVERITLTGFDHFDRSHKGMHHYWMSRSFGQTKEHDGEAEAAIFAPYAAKGRMVYLA